MSREDFNDALSKISQTIGDRPLDFDLQVFLNENYPADDDFFRRMEALCAAGEKEGWLCAREAGGIRFGRVIKPGETAGRFSVDVVRMENVKGPHHVHPKGEIGMIMPIEGEAKFDDTAHGWYVYEPDSAHWPTVSGGSAYVLYLLPDGAIEFTGQ